MNKENQLQTIDERLAGCEERIASGWLQAARALIEIRDEKLYRRGFKTFQQYCTERWGYKKAYTYNLINAAETFDALEQSSIVDFYPSNEAQMRPLALLPADKRPEAWRRVVEVAPRQDDGTPKITASFVDGEIRKIAPEDAIRRGRKPATQDEINVRDVEKAFRILATMPFSGDITIQKYGMAAFPHGQAAIDWMMDFAGEERGKSDIGIRLADNSYWHPTQADVELWTRTYATIDVDAELRKCAAWNDANPGKRKTHKGVKRHVNSWLSSASDRRQQNGAGEDANADRHMML